MFYCHLMLSFLHTFPERNTKQYTAHYSMSTVVFHLEHGQTEIERQDPRHGEEKIIM